MSSAISLALVLLFAGVISYAPSSAAQTAPRLRVGIVGLVHGHVDGFFKYSGKSPAIEIVGMAEPDPQLLAQAGKNFGFDRSQLFSSLEEMIAKAHPQAVLAYTNTLDHRKVVEVCAQHGVHVMMEKPLAVTYEDAIAIEKAAEAGKIHVLVNYGDLMVSKQSRGI